MLPRSMLNGIYLFQNRKAIRVARFIDHLLGFLPIKHNFEFPKPKRILISNCAHMGDVILSTSVIKTLRDALPDCEIGIVVGSWSKPVIDKHPDIKSIHIVDHWKANRGSYTFLEKLKIYWTSRKRAMREIKKQKYDVVIDLCFYYPNLIPLWFQAGIPVRIGYSSGGFGPLLTHSHQFVDKMQSVMEYYNALLLPFARGRDLKPQLPPLVNPENTLKKHGLDSGQYTVIHMGSGDPTREWPLENWIEVGNELNKLGRKLVFTGYGQRENSAIEKVLESIEGINLCNLLSFDEFRVVIALSNEFLGVNTGSAHIAATYQIPSYVIFHGIDRKEHWSAYSPKTTFFTKSVKCSPCFQKNGCVSMDCIKKISPRDVINCILR
ncbi:MAG: glycosyltransferase family 9 protein [Parachlamydiales bacterium]|nr:glycosyltransferase family 9 protein [Parachlamydiales bacterium]